MFHYYSMNRFIKSLWWTILIFFSITTNSIANPNLTPYQLFSDKIVVGAYVGTTDTNPLYNSDNIYVSWAAINNGTTQAVGPFSVGLYIDGLKINEFSGWGVEPLPAGWYIYYKGYNIGLLDAGEHTISIRADSTGVVAESNENDNIYSKKITVLKAVDDQKPIVWRNNNHSYRRFEYTLTWQDAKTYCEAQSGYLATITSKEENDFVLSQFGRTGFWLGGTDDGHEGTWSWVTNEPWSYSNWNAGEPNNVDNKEHFLEVTVCGIGCGGWNDNNAKSTFPFLCEFNNSNSSIVLSLEEPANGSAYSGISNVRGWAVAPQGLAKIELYVDGAFNSNVPLGGQRSDVGASYPNYPGSANSGFAMAFNYGNISPGTHTFLVRAVDTAGGIRDTSANFTVARFANAYMGDPAAVNLDQATLTASGNAMTLNNLLAEGRSYTIRLDWRTATQGFALTQINAATSTAAASELDVDPSGFSLNALSVDENATAELIQPAAAGDIILALEEPTNGSAYSGIANVRGYAVAPQGLARIELYVDSQLRSNIPLGGRRNDVGAAYPNYPGSAESGFAMAFNYSGLDAGSHTFTVRAVDNAGAARDASASVNIVRFSNPYIADPGAINVNQATLNRSGNTIQIEKLSAESKLYDVQLDWRPAAQGFALTRIDPAVTDCRATLSSSSIGVRSDGDTGTISVTIPSGCPWSASSNASWITLQSTSGVGSGTVTYTVSRNNAETLRMGTLTIAGQPVTVNQDGIPPIK